VIAEATSSFELAASLYAEAAEAWKDFPAALEEGLALLGSGRCLAELGYPADDQLRRAREILQELGARPSVAQADALLERTIAQTF
jgi:hypothetical protein